MDKVTKFSDVFNNAQNVLGEMIDQGKSTLKNKTLSNLLNKQTGGRDTNGYYLGVGNPKLGGLSEIVTYSTCDSPVFPVECRDLRGGKSKRKSSKKRKSS